MTFGFSQRVDAVGAGRTAIQLEQLSANAGRYPSESAAMADRVSPAATVYQRPPSASSDWLDPAAE